jgi:hypothetical protein
MYELVQSRRATDILAMDITSLLDGNLDESEKNIRIKFFDFICGIVDNGVRVQFRQYRREVKEKEEVETSMARESRQALHLTSLQLVKKYVWPKIIQMGLINTDHYSAASSLIDDAKRILSDFGGAAIFTSDSYNEFVSMFMPNTDKDIIKQIFDLVDIAWLYDKPVYVNGERRRTALSSYIDSLEPDLKKVLLTKVVYSPAFNTFYALKKRKDDLKSIFGNEKSDWAIYLEKNALKA